MAPGLRTKRLAEFKARSRYLVYHGIWYRYAKVFEKLVTLVGKITWGSNEKEPNISKKFDTDLSLSEFRRLILKSPIKIRDFFSLLTLSRRGYKKSLLKYSVHIFGCLSIGVKMNTGVNLNTMDKTSCQHA